MRSSGLPWCVLVGCFVVASTSSAELAYAQGAPKGGGATDEPTKAPDASDGSKQNGDAEAKQDTAKQRSDDEPKGKTAPPPVSKTDAAADKSKAIDADPKKRRPLPDYFKLVAGPLTFAPIVLLQTQALPYVGKNSFSLAGDPADTAGFRLQRARFGLEVNLANQAKGRVSVELGSREDGAARIHDAWLAYIGIPYAQFFVGAQTVPFSRSEMIDSSGTALADRPLAVRSIAPGQQVGIVGHGAIGENLFTYDLGVFNGFNRADQFYQGYSQNYAPLGNRFNGLAYVIRLGTEPIKKLGATVADPTHESPRFGLGANYYYSDGGARGIHTAGVDALVHAAGFHFLGEFLFSDVIPKSVPAQPTSTVTNVKTLGFVAEAGYMIVEDLFGLNARFEYIDPNTAVDDEGDVFLVGGGPSFQFLDGMVKAEAEYMHREERHGMSQQNDYVLLQGQLAL